MIRRVLSTILFLLCVLASTKSLSQQLRDLYEPEPITFKFETPGWYILYGIILITLIMVLIVQIRKYIKNRYRREALQEMDTLDGKEPLFPKLFVILKNTAMRAFGREEAGQLYGKEWLSFLEKTGWDVQMVEYHEEISHAVYEGKELEPEVQKVILSNAKKWVKTHAG